MVNRFTSRTLLVSDLGLIDYKKAWDLQKELFEERQNSVKDDILLLLEHPHTYTLGKTADRSNLIGNDEFLRKKNISVYDIDRGGDITYHGPGQIVGYPILNLAFWEKDTGKYLRGLEEIIIRVCRDYGVDCSRKEKYTGVWIEDRKICAIGIKVKNWITMHGFALNVNTDLSLFDGIIPCGIKNKQVTSLQKELGKEIDISEVKEKISGHFKSYFNYNRLEKIRPVAGNINAKI